MKKHWHRTKKRLPPSPALSLPIIGHLYLLKKPLHRTFAKLSRQYGPILYIHLGSRPLVLVSSPSAAEECFTKNDITFANRPMLLAGKHLGYNFTTLVWASYGPHWRNLRRIATLEILSSNRLQISYGIRRFEARSWIRQLFKGCQLGGEFKTVDMKRAFFELTLNVMMKMIAGKRYYGEDMAEMEEARQFKEILTETFELSGATNIGDFLPLMNLFGGSGGLEKRLVVLQRKRDKFMQDLIEQHRKQQRDSGSAERINKTMIDILLSLQEAEPEYYTDEIIRGMIQVKLSKSNECNKILCS